MTRDRVTNLTLFTVEKNPRGIFAKIYTCPYASLTIQTSQTAIKIKLNICKIIYEAIGIIIWKIENWSINIST